MKKYAFITAVVVGSILSSAQAQYTGNTTGAGGYNGPSTTQAVTTIKEAKELRDDANVRLQGQIVKHIDKDKYLLKDKTGEIVIEIDKDDWNGLVVNEKDVVEIVGEVDKDWNSVEIDVDSISKVQ